MYPAGGFSVKPMYITRIEDKHGNPLQVNTSERKEVISAATAYNIITMMNGVMKYGTGKRAASYGINVTNVSGKTGTTNDNSDAWFMGYTPQLLCGVWTGCDDRFIRFSSTSVGQGSSVALPVWAYFYSSCLKDRNTGLDSKLAFAKPEGMAADTLIDWTKMKPVADGEGGQVITGGSSTADDYGASAPAPAPPPPANKKDTGSKTGTLPKQNDY
jgi:penicillin-binding protein 1A